LFRFSSVVLLFFLQQLPLSTLRPAVACVLSLPSVVRVDQGVPNLAPAISMGFTRRGEFVSAGLKKGHPRCKPSPVMRVPVSTVEGDATAQRFFDGAFEMPRTVL
jgi:hypothetical protein